MIGYLAKSIAADWRDWLQEYEGAIGLVLIILAGLAPFAVLVTDSKLWLLAWPTLAAAYVVIDRLNFQHYLDQLTGDTVYEPGGRAQ